MVVEAISVKHKKAELQPSFPITRGGSDYQSVRLLLIGSKQISSPLNTLRGDTRFIRVRISNSSEVSFAHLCYC